MARKKIFYNRKSFKPGKLNLSKKWKKEIGEFSGKTMKFTFEEARHPIQFESGSKLKESAKLYLKI